MFVQWLKHIFFASPAKNKRIGEVFTERKIISQSELDQALRLQKEKLDKEGKAVQIARIIVEMGFASEKDLVDIINDHYKVSIESLSENTKDWVGKDKGIFNEAMFSIGWPVWFQLSVTIAFILLTTLSGLFYFISEREKGRMHDQVVEMGKVSLHFFGKNASVPLLSEDIPTLNTLIKNTEEVKGHIYTFVKDNDNTIMAHTDQSLVGSKAKPFLRVRSVDREEDVTTVEYRLDGYKNVMDMSTPILFDGKTLGAVHIGLSVDFINQMVLEEKSFLAMYTLAAVFIGIAVALIYGLLYSRPISKLVNATREISKGNYNYRVAIRRKDELGRLARAFNRMGEELSRQSVMKETFGKYVGAEVLDMIMVEPRNTWLKGRKNEASILFADVRGFTS
jgi:adenylate cyclase